MDQRIIPKKASANRLSMNSDSTMGVSSSLNAGVETVNGLSHSLEQFTRSIQVIQQLHPEKLQLISDNDERDRIPETAIRINSLVFQVSNRTENSYIVAVLDEYDTVSRSALETAVQTLLEDADVTISLAPFSSVKALCGFEPGTVPPLCLFPSPRITLVEESLLSHTGFVLGGGGMKHQSCLIDRELLVNQPKVHSAIFRRPSSRSRGSTRVPHFNNELIPRCKPFFAMEPPPIDIARLVFENRTDDNPFSPEPFSVVGRIRGIRRMAKQLAFCDFAPPGDFTSSSTDLPWRSPATGESMAVQMIVGKTLCQQMGRERGEAAIKSLRIGQLVHIQGKTNMGNRDSVQNWVEKSSLDLVVWAFQILDDGIEDGTFSSKQQQPKMSKRAVRQPVVSTPGMSYLSISELYGESEDGKDSCVAIVDDMESVDAFAADLAPLLEGKADEQTQISMVGLDCEWRPSFLSDNSNEPQVIAVFQLCLHRLKKVYLFDLQTLLRPLLLLREPMNPLEFKVSDTLCNMFRSDQLVKVGFQVANDLQRLAASYPHVPAFQQVQAVLDASTLGKTVMKIEKQGNIRFATSSLNRLTEKFIGKTLNKSCQCSDWSLRPLTEAQIEYAGLDAVVTPCIVDRLMDATEATFRHVGAPQLGRWKDDSSFAGCISSWRFLFLDQQVDKQTARKLNAKRIIGNPYIISQSWIAGKNPPSLPTVPTETNGPYTAADGILRVPSNMISLRVAVTDSLVQSMIGELVGKSKDRCLKCFLIGEASVPEGARLDFPSRSGYVEFVDAVALFVNYVPTESNRGRDQVQMYPNEWRDNGRTLTWFLREKNWEQGTSILAKQLANSGLLPSQNLVLLFVRSESGNFVFCGRCRVEPETKTEEEIRDVADGEQSLDEKSNWDLVQLNVHLLDHEWLQPSIEFRQMMPQLL